MKDKQPIKITAAAFAHAMMLIKENYPELPEERQMAMAEKLAAKICK